MNKTSPIDKMYYNIPAEFEKALSNAGIDPKLAVDEGKVNPAIECLVTDCPPKPPHARLCDRVIVLERRYLEFLWANLYSIFVLYDVGIQEKLVRGTYNGLLEYESPKLHRAKLLGLWSINSSAETSSGSDWPEGLPSPECWVDDSEHQLVLKVNQIFLTAVSLVLLHEYAHLTFGHTADGEKAWSLEQEKEADEFAFSALAVDGLGQKEKQVLGLSFVSLFTSSLYLLKNFDAVWQSRHPNAHHRIANALSSLNLSDDEARDYLFFMASIELQSFLEHHGVIKALKEAETPYDLFHDFLNEIDELAPPGARS